MGTAHSRKSVMEESKSRGLRNEDIFIDDKLIAPQLISEILLRINCRRTIGFVCPLVSKRWYKILSSPGFWAKYMRYWFSSSFSPLYLRNEPPLNVKKIALMHPFERNLIKNSSGKDGFEGWTIVENGGNGFAVEKPPIGCSVGPNTTVAFATSYLWCIKCYTVDLWEEGIDADFLDCYQPPITVSEDFNCRSDCAATYILDVQLVQDQQRGETSGNIRRRNQVTHPRAEPDRSLDLERSEAVSITRVHNMEHTAAEWRHEEYTFTQYPVGTRYVVFKHSGKDSQYWAGHYGSKMANASVVVHLKRGPQRTFGTRGQEVSRMEY